MLISDGVYQVGGEGFSHSSDAAVYLLHFNGESVLIDSGCGYASEQIIDHIKRNHITPESIKKLLLTHCHFDHTGGAAEIREKLGCSIIAHEKDAVFLETGDQNVTAASWYHQTLEPFSIDLKLTNSEQIIPVGDKQIHAYHIPGHSPGSVAFLIESENKKILFGQDIHGPLDASLLSDRKQYRTSLKKLLSLKSDILCEGHYGVIHGKEKVASFIQSYL